MLVRSKEISKTMRKLRLLSEMSVPEMATYLGVQQTTVWRYEQSRTAFPFQALMRLARLAYREKYPDFAVTFLAPISSEMGMTTEYLLDGIRRAA